MGNCTSLHEHFPPAEVQRVNAPDTGAECCPWKMVEHGVSEIQPQSCPQTPGILRRVTVKIGPGQGWYVSGTLGVYAPSILLWYGHRP